MRAALGIGVLLATASVAALAAERTSPSGETPVLFSADEVQYDEDLGLVVAKGNVELSQRDQILLADSVTYNQRTDTVTASGHVSLLQPSGEIVFADYAELHDNMRDGFIENVRMLLSDRSRMAGNTARRSDGNRTEIRRGVYSPCEPCRDDPTRAPLWQIKAESVVHDKQLQVVEYRDATLEIDGVPVFWTPYFSHPDPSVKRRSGFLAPNFGNSTSLGFHTGIPYYWVIGPDKDATFSPVFTTAGGTFLGGQYRQRFGDGRLTTEDSVTADSRRFTAIDPRPVSDVRWHTNNEAEFDLNENWRAGANVERASDSTYLARYHIQSPVNFLTSHVFAEDFGKHSYANISGWGFQSVQASVGNNAQPIVLPVADYQWVDSGSSRGALTLQANGLNLARLTGINTRRGSLGGEWRLPFQDAIGGQYGLTAGLRGDGYQSDLLPVAGSTSLTESAVAGRVFPQLALSWRYPWVRHSEGYSQMIEPIAMFAAAPNGGNPGKIPNEDSQGFEFDETSLFLRNRFPGFDRIDGGQRVDYGLRAGVYGDSGGSTRLLVGQSYSLQTNNNFLPGSGLTHHLSDVVGGVTIAPGSLINLTYRFRLDRDDLAMRRQEVAVSGGPANLHVSLSYLQVAPISDAPQLQKRKQLSAVIQTNLTRYWSLQLLGTRDFAPPSTTPLGQLVGSAETLNSGISLTYRDECIAFVTSLTQSGIRNGDVVPGTSLLFSVVFKNLGDVGAKIASFGAL
jgi:LPS-assembly protein